jgi:hypothetical protein
MYKTKITQVGLSKYHKSTNPKRKGEGLEVAKQQALGKQSSASGSLPPERTTAMLIIPPAMRQRLLNGPFRAFSLRGIDDRVELLLWNMSVYLKWWLEEHVSEPWLFSMPFGSWHCHMLRGFTMLSLSHPDKAWKAFGKACIVADRMMSRGHHDLLLAVFALFSKPGLSDFADIRLSLLRYLTRSAALRLGCRHSLTVILFHLLDGEVFSKSIRSALEMLVATTEKEPGLFRRSIWALNHAQCIMLIDSGKYQLALEPASRLFEGAKKSAGLGLVRMLTRSALLRQGDISYGLGDVTQAKHHYERSIVLAQERYGHPFPDPVGVEAVSRLARLQAEFGDYAAAEQLCRTALENTWTPLSEPDATGIRLALKATLESTMLYQWLQDQSGSVWDSSTRRVSVYYGRGGGGWSGSSDSCCPVIPPGR